MSRKREISSLILISWVNSCNDSLFADMTLTLQKSQVHCSGSLACRDEFAVHLIRFSACRGKLQNAGANCSTIGVCCVTITWQQIFEDALHCYGGRHFPACNYWTSVATAVFFSLDPGFSILSGVLEFLLKIWVFLTLVKF